MVPDPIKCVAQESWGHYVSVLTPGVRKSFCAIWPRDRRPVFPVFAESINVFLIGTDRSVKLALAPFCFALVIKENSGMCSLQLHKYTEPTALIFIIAEKYQKKYVSQGLQQLHFQCSRCPFTHSSQHISILFITQLKIGQPNSKSHNPTETQLTPLYRII